ncbi:hypothetical protein TSMEX_009823, partial [Taenia solium]|eukprot:TsM_001170100 transcript=TsM_001170100 gene=TsM_001170100
MGASFRIHLPERFNHKLAMHLGFLQEVINGPLYSVVTFVNKEFAGPLVDPSISSVALPGDIFIIILEGSLEIDVYPPECEETQSEMRRVCVSGDVVYIPHQFEHRAKLSECETSHAIVLSVINRAPVLVKECWELLRKTFKMKKPNNEGCNPFRELLMSMHNNPKNASDILYLDLNAEEGVEFVFRRWLKGVNGIKKQEICYAADKLRKRFMARLPAVNLDPSEKTGHAALFGPILGDADVYSELQIERLLNPHVEGRVKFERELEPATRIRLTRRSLLPIVEWLIAIYPNDVMICDLPGDNVNDK